MPNRKIRKNNLIFFVLILVGIGIFLSFSLLNPSGRLALLAPAPCTAVLPPTIAISITLCPITYSVAAPSIITANNVQVSCQPGTQLVFVSPNPIDLFQIAPGLTGVRITGCTIQGGFLNAIHVGSNVQTAQISNNIITGSLTAIKEEYGAQSNTYQSNTISNAVTGLHLEGQGGSVVGSSITASGEAIRIGRPMVLPPAVGAQCNNPSFGGGTNNPVWCSYPNSGWGYTIQNNQILNNQQGVRTYGLDNTLTGNTINSNSMGIEVNAIYAGTEINPNQQPPWNVQEYFQSGARVLNNVISNNNLLGGIQLNGRSNFYWQTSPAFARRTIIQGNTISQNTAAGGNGIVIGRSDTILPGYFYGWSEYTDINNNQIVGNANDGIILQRGNWNTDVRHNTINSNGRHGISIGTLRNDMCPNTYYFDNSGTRFIFQNFISNNGQDGIHVYNGNAWMILLNEMNSNGNRGFYVGPYPSGGTNSVSQVVCNDMSSNTNEGFNFDGVNTQPSPQFYGYPSVWELSYNRIMSNGADGVRYFLDTVNPASFYLQVRRTVNNEISNNGGYGVNGLGWYSHGFFANNIYGNIQGATYDSGANTLEDMWDEQQFQLGYDKQYCKCGTSCTADYQCGGYSNTCVNGVCTCPQNPSGPSLTCNQNTGTCPCYANPQSLPYSFILYHSYPGPYTPRGNYGLTPVPYVVPPSATPPLQPLSCSSHPQCFFNSCENYPAPVNNMQCGNGNFIFEPNPFGGYYQPTFTCPYGYYGPGTSTFPSQPPPPPPPPHPPDLPPEEFSDESLGIPLRAEELSPSVKWEDIRKDRRAVLSQLQRDQAKQQDAKTPEDY